jgi:hypothetical protein
MHYQAASGNSKRRRLDEQAPPEQGDENPEPPDQTAPERRLDLTLILDMQSVPVKGRPPSRVIVARSGPDSGLPWEDIYNVHMLPLVKATQGAFFTGGNPQRYIDAVNPPIDVHHLYNNMRFYLMPVIARRGY